MSSSYPITPVPKPRMTRRDRWKKRPIVLRYRAFCDEVRAVGVHMPDGAHVVFHVPMPKSWPQRRRAEMVGKPHRQKPDLDNLAKALLDALHDDDSCVWFLSCEKRWAETGAIEIQRRPEYE